MRKAKNSCDMLGGNISSSTSSLINQAPSCKGGDVAMEMAHLRNPHSPSPTTHLDHHEMDMGGIDGESDTLLPAGGSSYPHHHHHHHHHHHQGSSSTSKPVTSAGVGGLYGRLESQLSRTGKFCLLVAGLFTFFGMHNFLQEKIMHFPGFKYGWYLGFLEVAGVTVFSWWERRMSGESGIRRASLSSYAATTLCLMGSSSLSNIALNYINYPTKVVFRSCKLIPTMLIAGVINKRSFTALEYAAALAVCLGLILFAAADMNVSPSFSPWGLLLVSLSVVCDAVLPNLQERLFAQGSSRLEVTFYSNVFTLLAMVMSMLLSGDMVGATSYAFKHHEAAFWMSVYTVLAYVAISLHMAMVKNFGSVAAVLVGNSRKSMTIILSFLLFPKPFAPEYAWGGVLVLGGLTVSAYLKNKQGGGGGAKAAAAAAGAGGGAAVSIIGSNRKHSG